MAAVISSCRKKSCNNYTICLLVMYIQLNFVALLEKKDNPSQSREAIS